MAWGGEVVDSLRLDICPLSPNITPPQTSDHWLVLGTYGIELQVNV